MTTIEASDVIPRDNQKATHQELVQQNQRQRTFRRTQSKGTLPQNDLRLLCDPKDTMESARSKVSATVKSVSNKSKLLNIQNSVRMK